MGEAKNTNGAVCSRANSSSACSVSGRTQTRRSGASAAAGARAQRMLPQADDPARAPGLSHAVAKIFQSRIAVSAGTRTAGKGHGLSHGFLLFFHKADAAALLGSLPNRYVIRNLPVGLDKTDVTGFVQLVRTQQKLERLAFSKTEIPTYLHAQASTHLTQIYFFRNHPSPLFLPQL